MIKESFRLHHYLDDAVNLKQANICVISSVRKYTYEEIYTMSMDFYDLFIQHGVQVNDRIVIYSSKNAESISIMNSCSKCNAIYVPVSSLNPTERACHIIDETLAAFVVCDNGTNEGFLSVGYDHKLIFHSKEIFIYKINNKIKVQKLSGNDSAFILFTSGSTGIPKGVVISHTASAAFIDWASETFSISEKDIISSIAPFNFDLSVFDLYVSIKKKASIRLYTEDETKNALLMAKLLSDDEVTTIYGTPTFYSVLLNYGKLGKYNFNSLRNVLFAGEVFHIDNFRKLVDFWPDKDYFNLYGPTETNVCTYHPVDISNLDIISIPIGRSCDYAELLVLDNNDKPITIENLEGELVVSGESLYSYYWNDQVKTKTSEFWLNGNKRFYRTGDIVKYNEAGNYYYVSRKDRMIKKNGYRIEPGEVESVLVSSEFISNAVVLYSQSTNLLVGFVESSTESESFNIEFKQYCQKRLPLYMIPDKFVILETIPKTSSGKMDLQKLKELM